jgi:PAS domain S-box-containing protein
MSGRIKTQIAQDDPAKAKGTQAWQQTEDRYRSIYENAVEGIFQSTPGGRYLNLNPAMARIYGYDSPQDMIESITDIARQLYADPKARLEFTRRIKIDGKVEKFEACNLRKDGSLIWTSTNARTVRDARGSVLYYEGFVQDITERKRAEEEVRKRNEELALLNAINVAANHGESLTAVINLISEKVIGLFGSLGATLHLFNAERSRLVIHNMPLPPKLAAQVEKLIGISIPLIELDPRQAYPFRQVLESKQACLLTEPAQIHESISAYIDSSPFSEKVRTRLRKLVPGLTKLLGERSQLVVPLISEGEVIGTLDLGSRGMFTEDDLRRLESIAGQLTTVIKRKQAEEALLESEEKHRTLFETMTQGVVYQVADGKIISANPAAERILGLTLDQMQGRTSTDPRWKAIHEDGSDFPGDTHPSMVALTTGKDVHDVVMGVFNPELEDYRWININAIPQFRQGETVPHQVYTTFNEITERKRVEEVLHESEAKLKAVFEILPVGISILDAERKISYMNSALERILDISRDSLFKGDHEGRTYLRPDGTPMPAEEFASVRALKEQRAVHNVETGVVKEDGSVVWVSVSAVPVTFPDWKVVIVTSDITERRQTEEALRESEERYRELFENINSGVAVYEVIGNGQDFIFKDFNRAGESIDHDQRERLIGKSIFEVRPGVNQFGLIEVFRRVWQTGEPVYHPGLFYQDDKLSGWYENFVYKLSSGEIVAVFENITERKQAEEKIIRQMTNLQTLYEGARRLAEGLDLSYLSASVTRTCVDVFGIRLAWIGFAEPDGSVSVMNHYPAHIQYPRTTEERWDDAPHGHGPTGRAIRSATSQVITDINQAPEYIPWRIAALREGFCTSAAFPLISRDMAFGVLNLYSDQPGSFTPERVEFFQAYANQAAAALEKGRLFADLQSAHTRLRELSARLVEIEEEQRHEIARELHDSVGQSLTALNINLSILQNQLTSETSNNIGTRLADSIKLVEQAVERIRDVMAELRPPVLDDYGLLPALRWYAEQYTGRTNIRAVILEPQVAIPRLPPSMETALFRISQETLTNIARHAEASQVSLSLDMVDGSPRLTIQDDGIGFDPSQADTGWGLRIMRERAEAVGGKLVIETSPGKGTKIVVDVPLPPAGDRELPEKQEGI